MKIPLDSARSILIVFAIKIVVVLHAFAWPGFALPEGTYKIGPDDKLLIRSAQVQELHEKQFIVSKDGYLDLPVAGRTHVAGMPVPEAQKHIAELFDRYYHNSQVAIEIVEYHSQPISVLGAVTKSGIYQLQGRKNLADVLSMAGGLKPEAGYTIRIARKRDSGGEEVLAFDLRSVLQGHVSQEETIVQPHDVITVPTAELIYVIGDVNRAGGFTLGEKERLSVLQALALAQGPINTAALSRCTVLRTNPDGKERITLPVDVQALISGKVADVMLEADDILVVPTNALKKIGIKTAEAALQTVSGILIWRRP